MKVHFDGLRRPARVAKLFRSEFAAAGMPVGLAKAHDIAARAFGYSNYKELQSLVGKEPPSGWDEECPDKVVASRRARQASALAEAGLPADVADGIVGRIRPSGRTLGSPAPEHVPLPPPREVVSALPSGINPASMADLVRLDAFMGTVLTAPGEVMELSPRLARYLLALDDGTVVVAQSHAHSVIVSAAMAVLETKGFIASKAMWVSMEAIRHAYEAYARRRSRAMATDQQKGFRALVADAAERRAAEIHVVVTLAGTEVTLRSQGREMLVSRMDNASGHALCQAALDMVEPDHTRYRLGECQEGLLPARSPGLPDAVSGVRLQLTPLSEGGRRLVVRLAYRRSDDAVPKGLEGLGYERDLVARIKRMRRKPMGIGIIAGPTGSGKSMSLKRIIDERLPHDARRVASVQETANYDIAGAVDFPVAGSFAALGRKEAFQAALNQALNSNPDVLVIGRVDDFDAADLAWKAAITGKQVWTTVQASDAMMAFDQIRNLGIELYRIADHTVVNGVVAQRLLRRLCPHCSLDADEAVEAGVVDAGRVDDIQGSVGARPRFARPGGCDGGTVRCDDGHSGQVLVAEAIVPDETFMDMLGQGMRGKARRHWLNVLGGVTMLERAAQLVARGIVDASEVERCIGLLDEVDPNRLDVFFENGKKAA